MAHPRILNKTFAQISEVTSSVLERVYSQPSRSIDDAQGKFDQARGVIDHWAELTFDMGTSEHINVATQNELEHFVRDLDIAELDRWNMPPRHY